MADRDEAQADALASLDAGEVAELVRHASDDDLATGFAANRRLILDSIFTRMSEHLRAEGARDIDATVEWLITGGGGQGDRYRLRITRGSCRLVDEPDGPPDVRFTAEAVDFMGLVTGNANGPRLFLFGKLKVEGDLALAARVPALFTIPRAGGRDGRDAPA